MLCLNFFWLLKESGHRLINFSDRCKLIFHIFHTVDLIYWHNYIYYIYIYIYTYIYIYILYIIIIIIYNFFYTGD